MSQRSNQRGYMRRFAVRVGMTAGLTLGLTVSLGTKASAQDEIDWGLVWGELDDVVWDYDDDGDVGPSSWGDLPGFATCGDGQEQSPIDLWPARYSRRVEALKFNYSPAPLDIVDNGHTVQVNFPTGRTMTVGDTEYELLQLHYHAGSEHTVWGYRFPMEVHFVHRDQEGTLGVLGVFVRPGRPNGALQTMLDNLPEPGASELVLGEQLDPRDLLPRRRIYARYDGSLTTPPCTEGVKWHVLYQPITASRRQIRSFFNIYGASYRPVQKLNARKVKAGGAGCCG